jgi:outer membrane protein assembly factor BamB
LDDDSAYFFTGEGVLVAVSLADGKQRWRREPLKERNGRVADYGMASSPLLVGDWVIVIAGAPQATVVAYHRKSGEPGWAAGDDAAGYSSPALLTLGGVEQVVAFTGRSCLGLNPQNGRQLWRYPFATQYECNTASPIAIDGQLFLSAGESHGSVLLAVEPDKEPREGEAPAEPNLREVWASLGPRSVMKNEWQTSVCLDGFLYGLDNVGSAGPVTHLACIEAKTGKPVWQQPRFGKSNFIAADNKLWFSTMKGELVVVRASSKGYDEIGRAKVLGTTRQSPTLAGGLLYLRDDREIVCLDVRQP